MAARLGLSASNLESHPKSEAANRVGSIRATRTRSIRRNTHEEAHLYFGTIARLAGLVCAGTEFSESAAELRDEPDQSEHWSDQPDSCHVTEQPEHRYVSNPGPGQR